MKDTALTASMYSAGLLLLLAAMAKLLTSAGNATILLSPDPILPISYRGAFLLAGLIEFAVGVACVAAPCKCVTVALVAWLASSLGIYRLGLLLIGYHRPCHCLGTLADALGLSPKAADDAMKILLAYLLLGSYSALYWLWRRHQAQREPCIQGGDAPPCEE